MNLNSVRFPGLDGEYKIPQTAADVGAAPAGYGFGESAVSLSSRLLNNDADLEAALEAIYSKMNSGETKIIRFAGYPSNSDYNWFGFLFMASASYGSFVAYSAFARGTSITKAKYNGVWEPLEWVNPQWCQVWSTAPLNGTTIRSFIQNSLALAHYLIMLKNLLLRCP